MDWRCCQRGPRVDLGVIPCCGALSATVSGGAGLPHPAPHPSQDPCRPTGRSPRGSPTSSCSWARRLQRKETAAPPRRCQGSASGPSIPVRVPGHVPILTGRSLACPGRRRPEAAWAPVKPQLEPRWGRGLACHADFRATTCALVLLRHLLSVTEPGGVGSQSAQPLGETGLAPVTLTCPGGPGELAAAPRAPK